MFCQHHANATSPEPDSWGHALLRFIRHERRCWRRVGYWLARSRCETPTMRCEAWHAQVSGRPQQLAGQHHQHGQNEPDSMTR